MDNDVVLVACAVVDGNPHGFYRKNRSDLQPSDVLYDAEAEAEAAAKAEAGTAQRAVAAVAAVEEAGVAAPAKSSKKPDRK